MRGGDGGEMKSDGMTANVFGGTGGSISMDAGDGGQLNRTDTTATATAGNGGSCTISTGQGAISRLYEWRAFVQFATNPIPGETIDFYLKTAGNSASSTGHPDNDDGTAAGAVSSIDKLKNLEYLGSIKVDEAVADVEMVVSGFVRIAARAIQAVAWNASADALTTDEDENGFWLSPVPDEAQ